MIPRDSELGEGTWSSEPEIALIALKSLLPVSTEELPAPPALFMSSFCGAEALSCRAEAQLQQWDRGTAPVSPLSFGSPGSVQISGCCTPACRVIFSCKDMPQYKPCIYLRSFRKHFSHVDSEQQKKKPGGELMECK